MDQIMAEILKLVITAVILAGAFLTKKYLIPFVKSKLTAEQFQTAKEYAEMFVYMAQQVFTDKTGAERKETVVKALKNALAESDIELTDEFIDDMIEAAVKALRIAESDGKTTLSTEITTDSASNQEGGA